jgi:hypothetical protein
LNAVELRVIASTSPWTISRGVAYCFFSERIDLPPFHGDDYA